MHMSFVIFDNIFIKACPPYAGRWLSEFEPATYNCVSMVFGTLHSFPLMVKNQRRADLTLGPCCTRRRFPFHTTRSTVSSRFLTKSHDCADIETIIWHWHLPQCTKRNMRYRLSTRFHVCDQRYRQLYLHRQRSQRIPLNESFSKQKLISNVSFVSAPVVLKGFRFCYQYDGGLIE